MSQLVLMALRLLVFMIRILLHSPVCQNLLFRDVNVVRVSMEPLAGPLVACRREVAIDATRLCHMVNLIEESILSRLPREEASAVMSGCEAHTLCLHCAACCPGSFDVVDVLPSTQHILISVKLNPRGTIVVQYLYSSVAVPSTLSICLPYEPRGILFCWLIDIHNVLAYPCFYGEELAQPSTHSLLNAK